MLIKAGVEISRLNRNIRRALNVVDNILRKSGKEIIVTSTYEGNHGAGSLHYCNDAFDFRDEGISDGTKEDIEEALGDAYDVVWCDGYCHVEYDPK